MPFKLLEFDKTLATKNISLRIKKPGDKDFEEINLDVPFQFPPVITSDNKGVEYEEKDFANIEPLAVFKSSKARTIGLKWTYLVTGGKPWNCAYIANQIKQIRSFFYQTITSWTKGRAILIEFRGYDMIGVQGGGADSMATFRSDGVKVSYSPTVVDDGTAIWALKTDVELPLKLWSRGATESGEPMLRMKHLMSVDKLTIDWR